MSKMSAETLFTQIQSLPVGEKLKLRAWLDAQLQDAAEPTDEVMFVKPIRLPDPQPSQQWMEEQAHEYGGQWVAIDGNRLIAHGENAEEVFAAADADGAYLPLVTYIPHADAPPFAGV